MDVCNAHADLARDVSKMKDMVTEMHTMLCKNGMQAKQKDHEDRLRLVESRQHKNIGARAVWLIVLTAATTTAVAITVQKIIGG